MKFSHTRPDVRRSKPAPQRATIRRLYFAEHWRVGTIVAELSVHRDTVLAAIGADRFRARGGPRKTRLDPYVAFVTQILGQHPRLRATRVHEMLVLRGHRGSVTQTRQLVRRLMLTH